MLWALHKLLVVAYCIAPVLAVGLSIATPWRAVRRRFRMHPRRVAMTLAVGVMLGFAITLIYIAIDSGGGSISVWQTLLTCYFASAMIFIVTAFDTLVVRALVGLSWKIRGQNVATEAPSRVRRTLSILVPAIARPVLLSAIALPYVMISVLTYRPKMTRVDTPQSHFQITFNDVQFSASDGTRLAGWWIPHTPSGSSGPKLSARAARDVEVGRSDETVLICHGLGSNKADALRFAGPFHAAGYNVLVFDFRAYGASAGQISSLGNLERLDVLAAVDWLNNSHADQSSRIVGFGVSTGASALIEAATDDSPAGQSIAAVAAYGTFDDLNSVGEAVVAQKFTEPIGWLTSRIGLALGSVQVGANLFDVSPAKIIRNLWPRPLLVLHAVDDPAVPLENAMRLYRAADQPKQREWIPITQPSRAADDITAAEAAVDFFDSARSVPAI